MRNRYELEKTRKVTEKKLIYNLKKFTKLRLQNNVDKIPCNTSSGIQIKPIAR